MDRTGVSARKGLSRRRTARLAKVKLLIVKPFLFFLLLYKGACGGRTLASLA